MLAIEMSSDRPPGAFDDGHEVYIWYAMIVVPILPHRLQQSSIHEGNCKLIVIADSMFWLIQLGICTI